MPDQITRDLWLISIAANFAAFEIGIFRRAPMGWLLWSAFYLVTAAWLAAIDHYRIPGVYVSLWIIQQIVTVLALSAIACISVRPAICLVSASVAIAATVGISLRISYHWGNSPIEPAMWACGTVALSVGLIATIGFLSRGRAFVGILAGFLLSYSVLMLAGSEYLSDPGIGRAWSLMEIICFGAWAISFTLKRESL